MIKLCKKYYTKYREVINYLIAGVLTTIVSIISFELFKNIFKIHYIISNILSWTVAVIFAYIINRRFVFNSKTTDKQKIKEFINFIACRIATLVIETAFLYLMVDIIKINTDIAKLIAQFITIVLNYIFSKFFTFKK